jgi:hypothetical protein
MKVLKKYSANAANKAGIEFPQTILGSVTGTKVKETPYGVSTALVGRFRIIGGNGIEAETGVAYLPDTGISDSIASAVKGGPVEFALKVSKVESKNSPVGYVYEIENLIPPSADESDPIAKLRQKLKALELPAPSPEVKKKK